jgi:hypothetical protein
MALTTRAMMMMSPKMTMTVWEREVRARDSLYY